MLDIKIGMKLNTADYEDYVMSNFGRSGEHDEETNLAIAGLGLAGEAGETADEVKRYFRDNKPMGNDFLLEAGDCLHYLTYLLGRAGYSLEDAMRANVKKLDERFGR